MNKLLIVFSFFALTIVGAVPASAYVPPSAFIIKSVAAKHGGIKGVRVRSTVTAMEGEKIGTTHFKGVTYFNPQTTVLRSYAVDDAGQRLYGVERRVDTSTAADALLFWSNGKNLALALKTHGIPVRTEEDLAAAKDPEERRGMETEFLARWNSSFAWVIGKDSAQGNGRQTAASEPQLWIEKDTFLPLRLVATPQADAPLMDLQFEGTRYYHEFPYPRVITAVDKKEPVLRDEVQELALVLDSTEFKSAMKPGFTEAGEAAPGAQRDLIKKYFELIR